MSDTRRTLTGHTADVSDISWDRDGHRLTTSGADGSIRIWDAGSGQELLAMWVSGEIAYSVAWSPNGQILASTGSDGKVHVWDASKGYQLVNDPTFINWQTTRQLREAQELSKGGSHERADLLLTEVLKWKPEDADVLWARAAVRARMGHYQEAVDGFARVHDVDPDRVGALYATALLRLRLHDRDGFLGEIGRLLDTATDPNDQRVSACVWLCMLDAPSVNELPRVKDIVDRIYEASKTDSSLDYYAYLIDIRRGNPDREPMPTAEDRPAVQQAVDGLWESIRLIELDRRPESRVHYDRAHRLLATARENVIGGQWWGIVTAEILAREIEQRLEIAPE